MHLPAQCSRCLCVSKGLASPRVIYLSEAALSQTPARRTSGCLLWLQSSGPAESLMVKVFLGMRAPHQAAVSATWGTLRTNMLRRLVLCLRWGLMRPACALCSLPADVGLLVRVANATCHTLMHCEQVVGAARRSILCCDNVRWLPGPSLPPWLAHQRHPGASMEGRREQARRKEMKKSCAKGKRGMDRGMYVLPGHVDFYRRFTRVSAGLARLPVIGRLLATGR